jgi:hypothetical protein
MTDEGQALEALKDAVWRRCSCSRHARSLRQPLLLMSNSLPNTDMFDSSARTNNHCHRWMLSEAATILAALPLDLPCYLVALCSMSYHATEL